MAKVLLGGISPQITTSWYNLYSLETSIALILLLLFLSHYIELLLQSCAENIETHI